jgi:hypothetical protein
MVNVIHSCIKSCVFLIRTIESIKIKSLLPFIASNAQLHRNEIGYLWIVCQLTMERIILSCIILNNDFDVHHA